jgi:hypothetical protein
LPFFVNLLINRLIIQERFVNHYAIGLQRVPVKPYHVKFHLMSAIETHSPVGTFASLAPPTTTSVQLVVGKIDAGVAILLTADHHLVEFPTLLLPPDISTGSIIDVSVARNAQAEQTSFLNFVNLQTSIFKELIGATHPIAPILKVSKVEHEKVTLSWDLGVIPYDFLGNQPSRIILINIMVNEECVYSQELQVNSSDSTWCIFGKDSTTFTPAQLIKNTNFDKSTLYMPLYGECLIPHVPPNVDNLACIILKEGIGALNVLAESEPIRIRTIAGPTSHAPEEVPIVSSEQAPYEDVSISPQEPRASPGEVHKDTAKSLEIAQHATSHSATSLSSPKRTHSPSTGNSPTRSLRSPKINELDPEFTGHLETKSKKSPHSPKRAPVNHPDESLPNSDQIEQESISNSPKQKSGKQSPSSNKSSSPKSPNIEAKTLNPISHAFENPLENTPAHISPDSNHDLIGIQLSPQIKPSDDLQIIPNTLLSSSIVEKLNTGDGSDHINPLESPKIPISIQSVTNDIDPLFSIPGNELENPFADMVLALQKKQQPDSPESNISGHNVTHPAQLQHKIESAAITYEVSAADGSALLDVSEAHRKSPERSPLDAGTNVPLPLSPLTENAPISDELQ